MGIKDTLAAYAMLCRRCARRWWSISRSWTSSMQGRRCTPTTWKPTAPGQPLPVADARRPNFGSWSPTRSAGMADKSANGRRPSACVLTLAAETWLGGRGLVRPRRASDRRLRSCHGPERSERARRTFVLADKLAGGWRQATHGAGRAVGDANHAVMLQ
jgi:hypothetical protein